MNPTNISNRVSDAYTNYVQGKKPLVDSSNPLSIAMTHFKEPIYKPKSDDAILSKEKQAANALFLVGNMALLGVSVIFPPLLAIYATSIALRKGCEALNARLVKDKQVKTLKEMGPKKAESNLKEVNAAILGTKPIEKDFTSKKTISEQQAAHAEAKIFLKENLAKLGAEVEFISPAKNDNPKVNDVKLGVLNSKIFTWEETKGVTEDIKNDGNRKDKSVVIYGVASQFNGCEAMTKTTYKPGAATKYYQLDPTQGPKAQLAFNTVEAINSAGNIGYNALSNVLTDETRDAVAHGYFSPLEKNGDMLISQLSTDGNKIEYPCIRNIPIGGDKPVHQILIAAPDFGSADYENLIQNNPKLDDSKAKEVQFLCALQGFRAQFQKGLEEANKGNKVILKPVAVGLGAFKNDPEIVAKAYYQAAQEFEPQFVGKDIQVRLQIFIDPRPDRPQRALDMAKHLQLEPYQTNP